MDEEVVKIGGVFNDSLRRNNTKIRSDRADAISEDTEMVYKRSIEDIELKIKRLKRSRDNMMDLSPTDAQSLTLANDFDSIKFCDNDMKIGLEIRNETIKLEMATERFAQLFGAK